MENNELTHHGIKGQKWGERRFQNKDGSLTPAGEKRYNKLEKKLDSNVKSQTARDEKLLASRAKYRSRFEKRMDKKITRAESKNEVAKVSKLTAKKNWTLKDHDLGTATIKKAQKIGNDNHNNALKMKMKAVLDPSVKNTDSYKRAMQWSKAQTTSELLYGKTTTMLMEAGTIAANRGESWTRGRLNDD